MTTPQLEDAHTMLEEMVALHDNASTAAQLLDGIVLIELKRRIGYGKWGAWLKEKYPKSQDTAGRRIRVSEDFVQTIQNPRFRSTAEFDRQAALDFLRDDLTKTLSKLEKARLDLAHPLVRAGLAYAKGRSWYQLYLDLGPGERGGDTSAHRGKKLLNKSPDEIEREKAQVFYLPLQQKLFDCTRGVEKNSLLWLPIMAPAEEASLTILSREIDELRELIREAIKHKQREGK